MFIAASFLLQSGYHAIFQPSVAQAAPGINQTINFQGKLTNPNGSNVANGTYSVVFTLYTADSGGTALWTETQNVTTSTGLFRVALGSVNSLASVDFNQDNLYLGIKVGSDAEMTPRIRFTASPYAFNAQKVNGLNVSGDSGGLAFFTANGITTDSSLVWDNTNKRLGIGTAPTAALDVDGSAAISGELLVAGDLVLGGTTAANGSFHMDVSAGLLTLGTAGALNYQSIS